MILEEYEGKIEKNIIRKAQTQQKNINELRKIFKTLEESLICSENAELIYAYTLEMKYISKEKMKNAILKTGDMEYISLFAIDVDGAPVDEIIDYLIEV